MAKSLRPLSDRVIIEPREPIMQTPTGIFFPERSGATQRNLVGKVIAVGPGLLKKDGTRETIDYNPGDVVAVTRYSGHDVECYGRTFRVLHAKDVIGLVEEGEYPK